MVYKTSLTPAVQSNTNSDPFERVSPNTSTAVKEFRGATILEVVPLGYLATDSFVKGLRIHMETHPTKLLFDKQVQTELFNEQSVA